MLMGEPENHHFYDFGTFERVPGSQNQLFIFGDTPGYLNKLKKKPWNISGRYGVINLKIPNLIFRHIWNIWGTTNDEDPFNNFLRILDMR